MRFKVNRVSDILDWTEKHLIYDKVLENQSLRKLPLVDNAEESITGLIWKQILLGSCRKNVNG